MKITPIFPIVVLSITPVAPPSVAQPLTPDNSLGAERSVVTPVNPTRDHITGGAARGSNLFHSFREFNVDLGRSVYFANPSAIGNILTRVTGGNPSNIMGTLGVLGDANLFLVNPNGILFGPSARLDIRGSFFATTGDGIKLGENELFSATDLDPTKLLQVRPEALFHNALANHMTRVNNQGNLAVGTGSTLALHGGELTNSGSLTAPGGRVMVLGERIALLNNASIDVSSPTGGGRVFIGGFLGGRGNIPTAGRTYIGPDVTISADAQMIGDGGDVIVWADDLTGFYGDISARGGLYGGDGGFVEVSGARGLIFRGEVDTTAAGGNPGTLLLDPRNIIIADGQPSMEISDAQTVPSDLFNGAVGDTEDVTIYESQLEGLSGQTNVVLQATNDIRLADLSDNALSLAGGTGDIAFIADADGDGVGDFSMADPSDNLNTNGRDIAITAASLHLGNIDTSFTDNSGAIALRATNGNITAGNLNAASFSGAAGEIRLEATADIVLEGSDVDASGVVGGGRDITLNSGGSISLNNSFLTSSTDGRGDAGKVTIAAEIDVRFSGGGAFSLVNPDGIGDAGGIEITTGTLDVTDGAYLYASTAGVGDAGKIAIAATGSVLFSGEDSQGNLSGAFSEVNSGGVGNAGGIEIATGTLDVTDGALLDASTRGEGDAGTISITATQSVLFAGEDSQGFASGVFSQVGPDAVGNAGGIEITTGTLDLTDGAQLIASTAGFGDAGKIVIAATGRILFSGASGAFSEVNSGGVGSAGGIEIATGTLDLTDGALLIASTAGVGDAGKITIAATDRILFSGEDSNGFGSAAFSEVIPNGEGSAGGIEIRTGTLDLTDGAQLSASTRGEGDAGKIAIAATGRVLFSGEDGQGNLSGALSEVNSGGVGSAGGIEITTGPLDVTDGAQLSASTRGEGDAGKIVIAATGRVLFSGESIQGNPSGAFSRVNSGGVGSAGGIEIATDTLGVTDGAQLSASTESEGDAGTLSITATERAWFSGEDGEGNPSGAFSQVLLGAAGNAGKIEINTGTLDVTNGAQLSASTNGEGNSGNISITATSRVGFSGEGQENPSGAFSRVNSDGVGSAGRIEIATGTLDVTNGAQLSASTLGKGDAGNISITATERVLFSGESPQGNSSRAFSRVNSDGEGDAGGIEITTGTLDVMDGAQLNVNTFGSGDAGNLTIAASEAINISGLDGEGNSVGLFAGTASEAVGEASDIIISTQELNLGNAGVINARTRNDSRGGEIEINANRLSVTGGAQILSSSFSSGDAGKITIDARNRVTISGTDPTYNSRADNFPENVDTTGSESAILSNALSTGTAGTVTLSTDQLQVSSGGLLSVSSAEGIAGSLNLTADEINLNNGTFRAETGSGDQGNITINAPTVVLRNNSGITTNATGDATGGNITISTENLVARDDSDISANAIDGRGGNISITADGVFLDRESEITATSDRGVDGIVEIKTQEDPARGLVSLAESPIDASSLISKGCEEYRGSEFIITGRGGIPPHPFEMLPGEVIWLDWRAFADENSSLRQDLPEETSSSEVVTPEERELPDDEIRQAQGWLQLPDGTVVLTAYPVKMTPAGPVMQYPGCQIILGDREQ